MKRYYISVLTLLLILSIVRSTKSDSTAVTPTTSNTQQSQTKPITCDSTCFTWLPGIWTMTQNAMEFREIWQKDTNGYYGVGITLKGEDTVDTEKMWMRATDSGFFFIALVADNPGPVLFKLIANDSMRFVFENTGHDFPQRVIYRYQAPDSLYARIEGVIQGQLRGVDFPYVRVKE